MRQDGRKAPRLLNLKQNNFTGQDSASRTCQVSFAGVMGSLRNCANTVKIIFY